MEHGVKEFWIVDNDKKTVEIMVLKETGFETFGIYFIDDEIASPLLNGLGIGLQEIFPN